MRVRTPSQLAFNAARLFVFVGFVAIATEAAYAQTAAATKPVHWTKVSVILPLDRSVFPPGDGALIATENCLMCHAAGMVLHQPPMTQSEWLAEIRKMRAFFGAPMSASQDAPLAAYLARINGPGTARDTTATER